MKSPRFFNVLIIFLVTSGFSLSTQAQSRPVNSEEQQAIQQRIESLEAELQSLRQQLEPGPSSAHQHSYTEERSISNELELEEPKPKDSQNHRQKEASLSEAVVKRRMLEAESQYNPLAITTHRRNYLLPLTYTTTPNTESFRYIDDEHGPDRFEMVFQFSAKFALAENLIFNNGDLYFGYTQRSWWQAYNTDASSPFRETNYEPELFLDFHNNTPLLGWTNINNRIGFNHQSNGRSSPLSRSWNRITAASTFIKDDWAITFAPHWRVPESKSNDDNPDILDYKGYGDITIGRQFGGGQEATVKWRGNLDKGNMGTQIDYSWPLFGKVRGHIQYYYGYGDNLIDYDREVQRLGIGFSLNPLYTTGTFN
ncbi:phospholipase A [Halomonas halocynthiae]|uniref:phospholipase A n=1 Tax=Halomonas halocynthiae TaxID=176290 RepID=UPI000418C538|nr:phospholipase A [Halomonas halocynthiae]